MSGHTPVMLDEVLAALMPRDGGHYVDGTFGGGGYSRAILEAADCKVLGIDRDPDAIARGQALVRQFEGRLTLVRGEFSQMDRVVDSTDGVVLDLASRPFSSTSRSAVSPSATTARSTCACRRKARRLRISSTAQTKPRSRAPFRNMERNAAPARLRGPSLRRVRLRARPNSRAWFWRRLVQKPRERRFIRRRERFRRCEFT